MLALKDRVGRKLALIVMGAVGMVIGMALVGVGAVAETTPKAQAAYATCYVKLQGGFGVPNSPCVGPVITDYTFDGYRTSNNNAIYAKGGPQTKVGTKYYAWPTPEQYVVSTRTFTWHSGAKVKLVAVFVEVPVYGTTRTNYRRVPTGPHSGHATLTNIVGHAYPQLLLEGVNIR